ncbi:MAG: hypothetical protein DRI61_00860 [Chloroflexi bacterium]|nr:MAG: hypothetical protein DRI61_00860 [Chloroflexota bacterium]
MIYILTQLSSNLYDKTTGVKLAEINNWTPINNFRDIQIEEEDVLIRYGVSSYPNKDLEFDYVLNKADDIKLASNKLRCSRYLLLHGVLTPTIYIEKDLIEEFPVLGRRRYHSRGDDIVFIENRRQLRRDHSNYYVKYIDGIAEYRLHVFRNLDNPEDYEAIRLCKKINTSGEEHRIRNVEHGYVFKDHYHHDIEIEEDIIREGIRAMKTIGLDFGAIDVLIERETLLPWILEINTAPRLNKYGRQLYSYYFNYMVNCGEELNRDQYSRIRQNEGRYSVPLPIRFRDIVKEEDKQYYR